MATKKLFDHPDQVAREYTRQTMWYAKQLQKNSEELLVPQLDELILAFQVEMVRDAWDDMLDTIMGTMNARAAAQARVVIEKLPDNYVALSKFNERQFKMVVKSNTGLDLPPVMPGSSSNALLGVSVFRDEPFLQPLAKNWVKTNTDLIKTLPTKFHPELEGIVRRGVTNGTSVKDLTKQIRDRYGNTEYRAKLIAQDQINKGNADLTRYRLQQVGVTEYIWRSVQDNRVRPEHQEYNGNQYAFNKPPPEGNPGQPVRCRCRAEAVWDDINDAIAEAELGPGGVTNRSIIFGEADKAWAMLGNTQELKQVLAMRKQLMTTLEQQFQIPRTTASVVLGDWQKARLSGAAVKPAKVTPLAPPVAPPVPAQRKPASATKRAAKPVQVDPMTQFDPALRTYDLVARDDVRDWNYFSFEGAPVPIKQVLMKSKMNPDVSNQKKMVNGAQQEEGAWCHYTYQRINMPSYYYKQGAKGQSVWRHETGHYMDGTMGEPFARLHGISNEKAFKAAVAKDKGRLMGKHAVPLSNSTKLANADEVTKLWNMTEAEGHQYLAQKYAKLGFDYEEMKTLYHFDGMGIFTSNYKAHRSNLLKMAQAIDNDRAEDFVFALGGDTPHMMQQTWQNAGGGNFSDMLGSLTKNQVSGFRTFFGHETSYYSNGKQGPKEVYANFFALYGTKAAPGWARVFKKFVPATDKLFRQQIEEYLK